MSRLRPLASALLMITALVTGCARPHTQASGPVPTPTTTLDAASIAAAGAWSQQHGGQQLLVLRDGEVIGESNAPGWSRSTPHRLFSGTKTFALALVARLQLDGRISLDDPASNWLPTWAADPAKKAITIRQLLGLVSGIDPLRKALRGDSDEEFAPAAGATDAALAAPIQTPPGTEFSYGPAAFFVIGAVARAALGLTDGGDPARYLQRTVFDPLGIKPARWSTDDSGQPDLAAGVWMSPEQWGKFGTLLLANGSWHGTQLLDATVIEQAQRAGPTYPGYGLGVWLARAGVIGTSNYGNAQLLARLSGYQFGDGVFTVAIAPVAGLWMAAGYQGQRMYLVPGEKLTIIRTGEGNSFDDQGLLQRLGLAAPN